MIIIIAERTLEIDEEMCVCFIEWQKAFDRVNWTKLMQILKRIGVDWRERRLFSKLYMEQKFKVRLDRGEIRSVQIGRGVRQGCCLSPILFNLYNSPTKAPGPDHITAQMIQELPLSRQKTLLQLYNAILRLEYWPTEFKQAR